MRVTSPDRELLPGVTKLAALDYFLAVGDGILAALRGRPVMLERRRDDEVFFQRRLPKGAPEWVTTVRLAEYDAVCPEELAVVAWMVNLGTVTFHPWPVRRDALGRPDLLLIDLDPQAGYRVRATPCWSRACCARCWPRQGWTASRRRPARAGCT